MAETCCEYRSYLIKILSIVAKQKVLLFTLDRLVWATGAMMTGNHHFFLLICLTCTQTIAENDSLMIKQLFVFMEPADNH
jgi:hypothetical protein